MSNIFEKSLPVKKLKHSVFDLSRDYKTSFNMGQLIPVYMDEVIPGDSFHVGSDVMLRFSPLLAPIMDRVDVRLDFFFVPNRLVYNLCRCTLNDERLRLSWEDFITGGASGKVVAPCPAIKMDSDFIRYYKPLDDNHLLDYFGFHSTEASFTENETLTIENISPILAYNLIADTFYRDQTFQESITDIIKDTPLFDAQTGLLTLSEGVDYDFLQQFFDIRTRLFSKDYFTTAMPSPQRGDSVYLLNPIQWPDDGLNLAGSVFVNPTRVSGNMTFGDPSIPEGGNLEVSLDSSMATVLEGFGPLRAKVGNDYVNLKPNGLYTETKQVQLTDAYVPREVLPDNQDAVTINDFFTLQSIQRWLNHNQNFGGRYNEQLLGHFRVLPSDARLSLPEYLGGGKAPVMISEVLQTAESDGVGVGDFAGHGIAFGKTSSFKRFFNEHGLILGILSVTPKNSYTTAVPKIFFKTDKFDYAFPEFANIGEQPIKNKEIFLQKDGDDNEATFGYTPRYSEYRVGTSISTGSFRSDLSYWHLGRIFSQLPTLSEEFLKITDDNTKRIFQVTTGAKLYVDVYHNVRAVRPLPLLPNSSLL